MYTKKLVMLYMIILAIFAAPLLMPNASAQNFTLSITPATQTVGIGQEITANVSITVAAPGIFSYQLEVHYNTTLLNGTNAVLPADHFLKPVSPTNIFSIGPTINQTTGVISFVVTLLGSETPKSGSGTLGTMTFIGTAEGNATLSIEGVILVDPTGQALTGGSNLSGFIYVIPEFSLIALMAAFAVMSAAAVKMKKKLK